MRSSLSIFNFTLLLFWCVLARKPLPIPKGAKVFFMFSYKIFYNFQFYIWEYGSLEVTHCLWCALMVNIYVLFYIGIQVIQQCLLKKLFFLCWHSCHKTIDYLLVGPFLDSISCFISHKKENNITHKITTHISSLLTF